MDNVMDKDVVYFEDNGKTWKATWNEDLYAPSPRAINGGVLWMY